MTPKDLDFETIPNWLSSAMTTHSSIVRFISAFSRRRAFFSFAKPPMSACYMMRPMSKFAAFDLAASLLCGAAELSTGKTFNLAIGQAGLDAPFGPAQ